ncbi:MAG: glycosyltransferase family 4 protein [Verrucomicrobiota bacterium]
MSSKIILITHEFSPYRGGIATYSEEVAQAATELGYSIEVWTQGSSVDDHRFSFPIRRLPGAGNLRPISLLLLTWALYQKRETLKHSRVLLASRGAQWAYMTLFRLLGWNPGKEIITAFHGTEILRYARSSWLRKTADLFFTKAVHRITTASFYSIDLLREQGFESWAKEAIVARCALKSDFSKRYSDLKIADQREPGAFRILTLARIHPRKGQLDVAKALGQLPPNWKSQVVYQIAGKGDQDYLQKIQSECQAHDVSCEVLGEIPEDKIGEVYQRCDLYVMTSHSLPESVEGFGMTYLEAGFFEKPVIGYRTGGVSEAVLAQKTGLLVAEGDLDELSAAIQKILENPSLGREMGKAGRDHALSFSWKNTAQTLFSKNKETNV